MSHYCEKLASAQISSGLCQVECLEDFDELAQGPGPSCHSRALGSEHEGQAYPTPARPHTSAGVGRCGVSRSPMMKVRSSEPASSVTGSATAWSSRS